jgi:hypothetical protein
MGLESYLAVCLRGSDGRHLGHLAMLDAARMDVAEEDVATLAHLRGPRRGRARAPRPGGRARGPRARGSSKRPTPSAAGSGATCTTARSSGCSPSQPAARRAREGRRGRGSAGRRTAGARRPKSWTWPTRTCASWRAGCIPWRSRNAACPTRSARWRPARRCPSRSPWTPRRSRSPSPRPSTSWSRSALPTRRATPRRAPPACAWRAATGRSRSRSATTERAAPIPQRARGCAALPTASTCSAGGSGWRAPRAAARRSAPRSPLTA